MDCSLSIPVELRHPEEAATQAAEVEFAVRHIQALDRQHRLAFALAVGKLLFGLLFVPQRDGARGQSQAKGRASLSEIAADPRVRELGLRRSSLHNFVRVYAQVAHADPALQTALEALSLSHQVRLLRLRHAADKRRFAQKAADGGWTVLRLEAAIDAELAVERATAGHERPGRRPLPAVVKRSRAAMRAMDGLLVEGEALHTLGGAERRVLRQRLETLLSALGNDEG